MNTYIGERTQRFYKAGGVIFKENDYGASMYIISSGTVEVSTIKNDQKIVLATLGKGSIFGEMALIDQPYRSATVTAISDVSCIEINKLLFNANMQKSPGWLRTFFQILVERLRESNKKQDTFQSPEKSKQIILLLAEIVRPPQQAESLFVKIPWADTIHNLEIILNIPANFIERIFDNLIQTPMAVQETDFHDGRLLVIKDIACFMDFANFCKEELSSKIHKNHNLAANGLTKTESEFLNFIGKLVAEQGGGTDLELNYMEARCLEILKAPLEQYKPVTDHLIKEKVLNTRKTDNGDKFYDVDKNRFQGLLADQRQSDSFQKYESLIGRV
jgi:CRP/FNR family cyclic AMP-dependent transcriptional regulator